MFILLNSDLSLTKLQRDSGKAKCYAILFSQNIRAKRVFFMADSMRSKLLFVFLYIKPYSIHEICLITDI